MLVDTQGPMSSWITTPAGVAYAPRLASDDTRSASTRPDASSAPTRPGLVTSRPCDAARNSSMRSAHHLSAASIRARSTPARRPSGYNPVFIPKPPPTSPHEHAHLVVRDA